MGEKGKWGVCPSPAYEVDAFAGLGGASMSGVEDAVVEGIPKLLEASGERPPKGAFVGDAGGGYVLKYEGSGFECGNAVDADFGGNASAFLVVDSLLLAKGGERLAGETCNVEVYGGFGFDIGFAPGVHAKFTGLKVVPYELTG